MIANRHDNETDVTENANGHDNYNKNGNLDDRINTDIEKVDSSQR